MPKTFKSYIKELAQGGDAKDFKGKKDDDREVKDYLARSKGEQDFVDQHKVQKTNHPVAGDNQFGSAQKQNDSATEKRKVEGGERTKVKQGTSEMADKSGFKGEQTGTRKGDNRQGDKFPVLQGSSVVEQIVEHSKKNESVDPQFRTPLQIVLENEDKLIIDQHDVAQLAAAYSKLNGNNKSVFENKLQQGGESFNQVLRFARMVK